MMTSSESATASINTWRAVLAVSSRSAGISSIEYSAPMVSSCHRIAFIVTRSTTPANFASAPIWMLIGIARAPKRSTIVDVAYTASAPALSILLMKQTRGTLYLSACRHTVSDCGCTPATASKQATAPSSTRSERSTSAVKSTWPGVSMMLMRMFFQVQVVAARRNRDAALLLLLHPIHGRSALMHLSDTVRDTRIEENALGRRRLAGVDVSHNPMFRHLARGTVRATLILFFLRTLRSH